MSGASSLERRNLKVMRSCAQPWKITLRHGSPLRVQFSKSGERHGRSAAYSLQNHLRLPTAENVDLRGAGPEEAGGADPQPLQRLVLPSWQAPGSGRHFFKGRPLAEEGAVVGDSTMAEVQRDVLPLPLGGSLTVELRSGGFFGLRKHG